jgi:hypothetical protein
LAQIVASQRCWANGIDRTLFDTDAQQAEFLETVQAVHNDWNDPNQILEKHLHELRSSVRLVRLVPSRLELLETGPGQKMWTRIQWRRKDDNDEDFPGWHPPERLLPY